MRKGVFYSNAILWLLYFNFTFVSMNKRTFNISQEVSAYNENKKSITILSFFFFFFFFFLQLKKSVDNRETKHSENDSKNVAGLSVILL